MLYLVKRSSVYYFRLRIPKDVKLYFNRTEIQRSLSTSNYRLAKSLAIIQLADAERVFTMIRSKSLTLPLVHKMVQEYLDRCLDNHQKSSIPIDDDFEYEMVSDWILNDPETSADANIASCKMLLARNQLDGYASDKVKHMLDGQGVSYVSGSDEFKSMCREFLQAEITYEEVVKARILGEVHPYELQIKERTKTDKLSTVMDAYLRRREITSKARSQSQLKEKFAKILECIEYETGSNDALLSKIDYSFTESIAKRLVKYPLYRGTRYKGKSLDEIYKLNGVEYPSYITADEEIKLLSSVFDFAIKFYHGLEKNYAESLTEAIIGKNQAKESDYRAPFNQADMQMIIDGLKKLKTKEGDKNKHLYLIPLIGLYQGMRVNEICQLYVEDIKQVDGIWCIDNNESKSGKSIKNANSIRVNPIHPSLIEIGLIRYWEKQKSIGCDRLWQGETKISCDLYLKQGNHSHYFDKWFNGTFKKGLRLSQPEKQSFHSLRHTFINWFSQNIPAQELNWYAVTALSGHLDKDDIQGLKLQGFDSESAAFRRYSKDLNVAMQLNTLNLLNYEIDLSGLAVLNS